VGAREIDPSIPRKVETVLMSALSKDPGDRYAIASELATELRRARDTAFEATQDLEEKTIVTPDQTGIRPSTRVEVGRRKIS